MNPLSWLIISTSIFLSTTLITVATHWLMVWACLEINTLSIIPVISKPHHPRSTEASTKYFLTQTLASTTLLFAATTNAMNTSNWEMNLTTNQTTMTIITSTLMMKMAAAPFHFWLPEVSSGATTMTTLTLLTWQKIAPLTILLTTHSETNMSLLLLSAIMSIMVGGLGAMNQTQLRKLMAYSSIAHTGWTIAILTTSPNISMLTFMIYTMTTTPILLIMNLTMVSTIKDIGIMWTSSPHLMLTLTVCILSLGGLPPLTGFMPKWLILNKMAAMNMMIEATTMALLSLISLFVYMRLMYLTSMTTPPLTTTMSMKWRLPSKKYQMSTSLATMNAALLLPMMPSI
uniref:NADH-ubiquinone oxidoreductase chain 2 n=1 Tax=Hypsiscopus plumbea TaxID=1938377 RepID=A9X4G6_HYPPM|nr:NADH dehydrogenase subunit 2 [Hypsiscopus plumbea]ABC55931.1 NADH dehydrogenase subunit 2 [Hypsiscopus plumbea]